MRLLAFCLCLFFLVGCSSKSSDCCAPSVKCPEGCTIIKLIVPEDSTTFDFAAALFLCPMDHEDAFLNADQTTWIDAAPESVKHTIVAGARKYGLLAKDETYSQDHFAGFVNVMRHRWQGKPEPTTGKVGEAGCCNCSKDCDCCPCKCRPGNRCNPKCRCDKPAPTESP